MQHWLVKEYAKLVGNHLQIRSGSFTGRGGGGSGPSEATASGFEKKTGPYATTAYSGPTYEGDRGTPAT